MIDNAQGQEHVAYNSIPEDEAIVHGPTWSKYVIKCKGREHTSSIGCVLRSTAHMSLCFMLPSHTWWALTACKAPAHNKGKFESRLYDTEMNCKDLELVFIQVI